MTIRQSAAVTVLLAASLLIFTASAGAASHALRTHSWAAPQIRAVTKVGVLGRSPATFAPQSALTQSALAAAIAATNTLQTVPPTTAAPTPEPVLEVFSTIPENTTIAGTVSWQLDAPGRSIDHIDVAVDGVGGQTLTTPPYVYPLNTLVLADGVHSLAVNVAFSGGGYAIAVWQVTVANAPGSLLSPLSGPVAVTIAKSWLPAAAPVEPPPPVLPARTLYRAAAPGHTVSIKQLDAALVGYLRLGDAARKIQATLQSAGLQPRPNTGTEAVARLLGLRLNHPAAEDNLELLPYQAATRAEAAWSFAQMLRLDSWSIQYVEQAADAFTLPVLTTWQRRLLQTAISYVGYPYVWGGTNPTAETLFGVHSAGGFDCSGFVWRVVKLTTYPGEGRLASVLRGRTTYVMSGEVPRKELIPAHKLQPADVMFFGAHGRSSKPSEVDHTALYLGNGWFVQSSDEGVTLLPFSGWYTHNFAWARSPLREAGLS
ncbi:MAG TPA: NlpC/P60 family protein [Gaiellaceae bacterium]